MENTRHWMTRSYFLVWQGQLVSLLGTQVFLVTVVLWLQRATESASAVGLLLMAFSAPAVILGPVAGALVDRWPRRSTLVVGDLAKGVVMLGVALALYFAADSSGVTVVALFVAFLAGGIVQAVWQPAALALMPDLVAKDDVAKANSVFQVSTQLGRLVSMALGGLLFQWLGAALIAVFDGLTYIYAAVSVASAGLPKTSPRAAAAQPGLQALKAEVVEGLRYVHGRVGMKMLFYTMTFLQFFLVPMSVLFPFYVDKQLLVGPEWYGYLLAANGLGTTLGFGLGGILRVAGGAMSRLIVSMLVGISLGFGSLGLVTSPRTAFAVVAAVGIMSGLLNVKFITLLQLAAPAEMRGRVFGLLQTIVGGLGPVAMGLSGLVADLLHQNIPLIYLVCGGMTAALSISIAMRPECRQFLAGEDAAPVGVPLQKPA